MPASEETYRSKRTLHIVFAITSVLMTLTVVWMIMADHLRPWKKTQRGFQEVETAKLAAQEKQKLAQVQMENERQLADIDQQVKLAKTREAENKTRIADLEHEIKKIRGNYQKLDTEVRFKKADLDSRRSQYDGMIDRNQLKEARRYVSEVIVPTEREYAQLRLQFEAAERTLFEANLRLGLFRSTRVEVTDAPPPRTLAEAAGFHMGDVMTVDQFEAFRPKLVSTLLGKTPSTTVEVELLRQGKTNELLRFEVDPMPEPSRPVDSDAAWVAFGLSITPLAPDVLTKRREDLTREADRVARSLEKKIKEYGQNKTWLGPVYAFFGWLRGLPFVDFMAPPTKIQQISLPELTINYNFKDVPRYDRCTTCHMGIDRVGYETTADNQPMPLVFRSHPHLTDGTTTVNPRGQVVLAGLYLDANGPHPINNFGCTICHGGQGSGTSFTYSSHEPNDLDQKAKWSKNHEWHKIHFWDEPMLPKRFIESSCLQCHHLVTDLNQQQAPKLLAGYQRIVRYGCTGCHTIGGEGTAGPDLADTRQVGPNLKHIASKTTKDWALRWIKNPHAFRPDSRMPRFYDLTNNSHPNDWPKNHAEIHAVTHYLFSNSTPPAFASQLPEKGDPVAGKQLFLEKGCLACHADRAYAQAELPVSLHALLNPAYALDPNNLYEPTSFPERVRDYAKGDFGPNLSSVAAKFSSYEQGYTWLTNWIQAPEGYHTGTLMPNLQLSPQESADIAAFLLSARTDWTAGSEGRFWPIATEVPPVDSAEVRQALDELMRLFLSRSKVYNKRTVLESELPEFIASLSTDEKLMYVGERTISRMGCFGCHSITGFEVAKPIGTPLAGWGFKSPTKLDYGHIAEYLVDQKAGPNDARDGTDRYYQEQLAEPTRAGFLFQKLHRPRSYDYRKDRDDIKPWDDRLRMPQFAWADDPHAIEEVMTFVLGLTGEKIAARYLPHTHYGQAQVALARGERLIEQNNCRGCHVFAMEKYTIAGDVSLDKAFRSDDAADPSPFLTNVNTSYENRAKDHRALYPNEAFELGREPAVEPPDGKSVTLEGMPIFLEDSDEDPATEDDRTLYVQLFRPVKIRGYQFGVGDTVRLNPQQVSIKPPEGGNFAWLYSQTIADQKGEPMPSFWNKLPPPLLREGEKVQTPWLTSFLRDPYKIRPAAQLRMPRFHWGGTPPPGGTRPRDVVAAETRDLANYFAARDGSVFPYQEVPQREQAYLADMDALFNAGNPSAAVSPYLNVGWTLITKNQCVQCHAIGQYKPTGEEKSFGPNLRQVATRVRPEYMLEWIANPTRFLPYTAMPQVIPPPGGQAQNPVVGVPQELEGKPLEQIKAMRDMLLNYVQSIEQQLATVAPPPEPPKPATTGVEPAATNGAPGANP